MLEPGDIVDGRFEVEGLLGEGGLAQVFRVRHTGLGSTHALKLLTWRKKSLAERLLVEGRIQAQLNHPNIVAVTDLVHHEGQLGLLMEFVDHQSLEEYLDANGGLGMDLGLALFAPILSAVTAAHDAGVTHRDLKPANILLSLTGGGLQPKVTDFGIAKVVQELSTGSTAIGTTMGTPGYVAPEQVEDSSSIDHRADIFALGAICWELITGARAFADENGHLGIASTLSNTPRLASVLAPMVPPHVDEALAKAMSRLAEDRFDDCRSFARALFAEHPQLLDLVLGQAPTGILSLENISETLTKSLSGETRRRTPVHSHPTLVATPEVQQPPASGPRKSFMAMGAAIGALLLGGVIVAAGGLAYMANDMAESYDENPLPRVGTLSPDPAPSSVVPGPQPPTTEPFVPATPSPTLVVEPVDTEPASPEPVAPEPVAPEPTAPAPTEQQEPDPVVPVPVPPEPVEPEPVVPEPAVVDAVVPEPEPIAAPEPQLPAVGGVWTGRANKQPLRLELTADGATVSGRAIFPGPSTREEPLRGSVSAQGSIEFRAADLIFVGTVSESSMQGTYRREGGKALDWSVQSSSR